MEFMLPDCKVFTNKALRLFSVKSKCMFAPTLAYNCETALKLHRVSHAVAVNSQK